MSQSQALTVVETKAANAAPPTTSAPTVVAALVGTDVSIKALQLTIESAVLLTAKSVPMYYMLQLLLFVFMIHVCDDDPTIESTSI